MSLFGSSRRPRRSVKRPRLTNVVPRVLGDPVDLLGPVEPDLIYTSLQKGYEFWHRTGLGIMWHFIGAPALAQRTEASCPEFSSSINRLRPVDAHLIWIRVAELTRYDADRRKMVHRSMKSCTFGKPGNR